jgi:tetratricopeptide (TPR) repeat protein
MSFEQILNVTKDYWFLITLSASAVLTVAYMIVFQVNPWDQQRSAKLRRERVLFHNGVGHTLMEAGHFKQAQNEFEEALKVFAEDHTALTGRYLAELFLGLNAPEWNPAIGFAIQRHIANTPALNQEHLLHIIDTYLGDLHERISNGETAKAYYQKALARKPDYPYALFTLGWRYYVEGPDIDGMENTFRKMTEVDGRDYRGFHGLGYALYMKAIREPDPERRLAFIVDAAKQSGSAKDLFVNQLNIIMDFGEVARSVNPRLSLPFHEYGKKVLEDPVLSQVGDNPYGLFVRLQMSEGQVQLENKNKKMAWVEYQLALDYLALERVEVQTDLEKQHEHHMEKALSLDPDKAVHPIYADQLSILDRLLPR